MHNSTGAGTLAWLPFLLQTGDALFPTGSYAHSFGLEECVRLELIYDESSLLQFLRLYVIPALRECELPYLRYCFEAAKVRDLAALCSIDREINAWKTPSEARFGSIQMGLQRLKAVRGITPCKLASGFAEQIDAGFAHGHHLAVCAIQGSAVDLPLDAALTSYAYHSLAAACAAAMKLIRLGQQGCQRTLRQAAEAIGTTVARSLEIDRDEAGWFNPLLEIASMRHEWAHERLFIS